MTTLKNRQALVLEAARKLNIVGTGQPLDADYAKQIDDKVNPLMFQLAADGVCNLVDPEFIPLEWFEALSGLLANVSASTGGKSFDVEIKGFFEAQLRRLTASRPSYDILEAEYF